MFKPKKSFIIILIVALSLSTTLTSYAADNDTCSMDSYYDWINNDYTIIEDEGSFYFVPNIIRPQMAGGIGRCTVSTKTFKSTVTRAQAQKQLQAISVGEAFSESLYELIVNAAPQYINYIEKGSRPLLLTLFGGNNIYKDKLTAFVNSGKSKATLTFYTKCVNRGYSYGEPMYDYEITSITLSQ